MLNELSDNEFYAWFAGFFDGEGCIHLPSKGSGIELTVANTNREIIVAIQDRWKMGVVTEVSFEFHEWKNKYHWRVRRYAEAEYIIEKIYKFLTVKRTVANAGLERIQAKRDEENFRHERNARMIERRDAGQTYKEIADEFGVSVMLACNVCRGLWPKNKLVQKIDTPTEFRKSLERGRKKKVNPKTTGEILERT